jgi:hypothetical protein
VPSKLIALPNLPAAKVGAFTNVPLIPLALLSLAVLSSNVYHNVGLSAYVVVATPNHVHTFADVIQLVLLVHEAPFMLVYTSPSASHSATDTVNALLLQIAYALSCCIIGAI